MRESHYEKPLDMTMLRHILLAAIIATVVAWVVTQWLSITYWGPGFITGFGSGTAEIFYNPEGADGGLAEAFHLYDGKSKMTIRANPRLRFFERPYFSDVIITIPFWLILTILLPPWWLMGRKSRQRKRWAKEGCCLSCGYNLQGSESGTCSECGVGYGHESQNETASS